METAIEVSSKLESLGILAGGIAHDFNNLLGGIYGYVDMAYASAEEEDNVRQYLSITMATIERARALTQQLLTFAKGGAPIQKVSPLFPFVKEVAQFALSGADIACNFDIPKGLWSCNYDSNQLGQVVDNLVINAKQAMPIGGTITVSAHNTAILKKEHPVLDDGDYVQLSIRDTGIGIQKDLLSRIFDPFFTTKSKGHGLGLATCYSIVNRHGGCIEVDSDPGKGTAFHIYLPAVKESDVAAEQQKTATHRGTGTILVMDDEEVMRDMICAMLASFGYRAVCKENGKEAVRYVEAVLKDSQMLSGMIFDLTVPGGMGGKEAIAAIREFNTEIPAFVASGYANDPVMRNPVQYGFTASIGKPFKRTELGEMLAKHVKASFSAEKKPHPVDGSPPSSTADSPETAP